MTNIFQYYYIILCRKKIYGNNYTTLKKQGATKTLQITVVA